MLVGASGAERDMLVAEIDAATSEADSIEDELRELMLPADPHDGKHVIMEIRGAEGGEEANLFARDLYEMYLAYAASRGWKVETLSSSTSEMGGFNEVTFEVRGETAWRNLKFEGGPHRVQRVPATESQGRIHTSSATVTVLPEVPAARASTPPIPRFASPIARRGSSSRCRMSGRNSRTRLGRWSCCAPDCSNSPSANAAKNCRPSDARRWAAAVAARR
jgi:hypothetical protein